MTQVQDNIGRTVGYTYTANGELATVTDPEQHVTSYTYDSNHRMLTVKPPNLQGTPTNLVTNEYTTAADAPTPVGWVKKQTHADGGVYQFAYTVTNGKSTQTDVTDPRGFVRRVTFNPDGYTLSDTRALGQPEAQGTTTVRQGGQFVASSTDALLHPTSYTYDDNGNVLTATRLTGVDAVTTTYTYAAFNQVATIADPLTHVTTFGYDAKGNRTSVTDALTHTTTFSYNMAGQVTSVTDPLQHTTTFECTGPDVTKITDPLGRITQRFFDAGGRLLSQTDPSGQITRFEYDKLNQLTRVTDPLGGVTNYGYDTAGRLGTVTDARTNPTTYGYDLFNRLASRTDPVSKTETFTYDVDGNPGQRVDRKGQVTTRTYDALNRLHQATFADNSTTTYTYDSGNRLATIGDSVNGTTITRTYDNLNRLTSELTAQGTVSYTYDGADRRATMTVAGQPSVTYGYDDANRLTSVAQRTSTVTITYDDVDRRSTLALPNGIVVAYGYDNANQLTSLIYTLGQTTLGTLTYTYDFSGRRSEVGGTWARTGLPAAVTSAMYDGANRLTQWADVGFSYTANGNLASDGLSSFLWDPRDQLSAILGATSAEFQYDALGRRTASNASGTETGFLYDGTNLRQTIVQAISFVNLIGSSIPDEYFLVADSTGSRTILADGLRSTVATVNESGSLTMQHTYEPFGRSLVSGSSDGASIAFTGREDDHTGFLFYRARYYSPSAGRFVSEDPSGFDDGQNPYSYASNSPTNFVDPFGLCAVDPDILQCLEDVFKKSAAGVRVESKPKSNSKWAATTRRNEIRLSISCDEFFGAHEIVLEEYYHVLEQWNTGRLNRLKYGWEYLRHGYENNKYEIEAKEFARQHLQEFEKCLACKPH